MSVVTRGDCGCVITYNKDDQEPKYLNTCPAHEPFLIKDFIVSLCIIGIVVLIVWLVSKFMFN